MTLERAIAEAISEAEGGDYRTYGSAAAAVLAMLRERGTVGVEALVFHVNGARRVFTEVPGPVLVVRLDAEVNL